MSLKIRTYKLGSGKWAVEDLERGTYLCSMCESFHSFNTHTHFDTRRQARAAIRSYMREEQAVLVGGLH
jgi:hypothetical protein